MRYPTPVLIACFLLLPVAEALADGKAYVRRISAFREMDSMSQSAVLHHADGRQRTLIALNMLLQSDEGAIWIVPVRGKASEVKIRLVDKFPDIAGVNPESVARKRVDVAATFMIASQLYTACICLPTLSKSRGGDSASIVFTATAWGLDSHLVDAASLEELSNAVDTIRGRSPIVVAGGSDTPNARAAATQPAGQTPNEQLDLSPFAPYFDGRHCFVVTMVASAELLQKEMADDTRVPCLLMDFPTETPWYPMRATPGLSLVQVVVSGWYDSTQAGSKTSFNSVQHRASSEPATDDAMNLLPAAQDGWVRYSRFVARGHVGDNFPVDLEFQSAPGPQRAMRIATLSPITWYIGSVLLFAFVSWIAAGAAGTLVYKNANMAWCGLANLATLGGVIALGAKNTPRDSRWWRFVIWKSTPEDNRWWQFVILFSVIFMLITIGLWRAAYMYVLA